MYACQSSSPSARPKRLPASTPTFRCTDRGSLAFVIHIRHSAFGHSAFRIGYDAVDYGPFESADVVATGTCVIRPARAGDERGAFYVCLKTGDHGNDAERFYSEDPDALGRIYV